MIASPRAGGSAVLTSIWYPDRGSTGYNQPPHPSRSCLTQLNCTATLDPTNLNPNLSPNLSPNLNPNLDPNQNSLPSP